MAKTIEITAYEITELSDKAKQKAYDKWLEHHEYFWMEENKATLHAFVELFPIKLGDWTYDTSGGYANCYFPDDNIAELSGARAMAWLYNNLGEVIARPVKRSLKTQDRQVKHKRIKESKYYEQSNAWLNWYVSAIKTETMNCPLTGYCVDNDIMMPIWDFIKAKGYRPNSWSKTTLNDIVDACLNAWVNACAKDYEYCTSMEFFEEECINNNWLFDEKGRMI